MVGESVVAFVTLFLGIVVGQQPVELLVVEPATRVEILLDGQKVAEMATPPWRAEIDLGSALLPHRLEAIAYNAQGRRLERIVQAINMPRSEAEVAIVLERDGTGQPRSARLTWKAAHLREPSQVRLALDGAPLTLDADHRAALPELDLHHAHLLRGEVAFGLRPSALRELAFGGEYIDSSQTELTAVAVVVPDKKTELKREDVEGKLIAGGQAANVVAIDETPFAYAFVFAEESWEKWRKKTAGRTSGASGFRARGEDCLLLVDPVPKIVSSSSGEVARLISIAADRKTSHDAVLETIINVSESVSARRQRTRREGQSLALAVAGAGLASYGQRQRRAVFLVASEAELAGSASLAPLVRAYLRTLGVPLYVWVPDKKPEQTKPGPWGEITWLLWSRRIVEALGRVEKELERQRIVWIDGTYLPQEITVAGAPSTFALVR
jgi:hypothetical protein